MKRLFILLFVLMLTSPLAADDVVDFNRDVRPILSNNCFRCHGPDEAERQGSGDGLRLDVEDVAKKTVDGVAAIVL